MEGESIEKDVYKITLPRVLADENVSELKIKIKTWLLEPATLMFIDFTNTLQISKSCVSEFLQFSKTLKANKKFIASFNVNRKILNELKEQGLDLAFSPVRSIEEAKKMAGIDSGKKVPKVDAELLSVFIDAAKNTLEVQASTSVSLAKKPYLKKSGEAPSGIAIAGVINLTTNDFTGSIGLCFKKDTFLKIYSNMTGDDCKEIDSDIQDAAGELLNIIYGQAKAILVNQKNYDLKPALPNVLVGDQIKIRYHTQSPVMILEFNSDAGEFHIEVVIDPPVAQAAA